MPERIHEHRKSVDISRKELRAVDTSSKRVEAQGCHYRLMMHQRLISSNHEVIKSISRERIDVGLSLTGQTNGGLIK